MFAKKEEEEVRINALYNLEKKQPFYLNNVFLVVGLDTKEIKSVMTFVIN